MSKNISAEQISLKRCELFKWHKIQVKKLRRKHKAILICYLDTDIAYCDLEGPMIQIMVLSIYLSDCTAHLIWNWWFRSDFGVAWHLIGLFQVLLKFFILTRRWWLTCSSRRFHLLRCTFFRLEIERSGVYAVAFLCWPWSIIEKVAQVGTTLQRENK